MKFLSKHTWIIVLSAVILSFVFPSIGQLLKPFVPYLLMILMFLSLLTIKMRDVIKELKNIHEVILMLAIIHLLGPALVLVWNDAAYALAEGKGYRFFIERMNEKAAELGMKNSQFTNPTGLDSPNQKTTPFDLSLAARALLKDPYLRKMVGTKEIIISDVDYNTFHTLRNVNQLLGEIQGLGGLKTGYTEQAGENLVSFYRHNGHDYIIVVMKSEDRFRDTRNLVDWIKTSIRYEPAPQF